MRTTEFNLKLNKINRPISEGHIKILKKSMSDYGFWKGKPIQINKHMEILDGHHRYLAAKELNIPYYFVIEDFEKENIEMMKKLNTSTKALNGYDYCEMYAKNGNKNYINFLSYLNKHPTNYYSHLLIIFSKNADRKRKTISEGKLIFEENNELYFDFLYFKKRLNFVLDTKFTFVLRMLYFFSKTSNKRNLIEELKQNVFGIIKNADSVQYKNQIIFLLNKNKKKNKLKLDNKHNFTY